VFNDLREQNIGVNVHYIPIHLQPFYAGLGFRPGDFPVSERYYERTISIPLFPALTESQQERVVAALRKSLSP
jgi:dTDP-4-amino-4,6-dideoxygalactose transaminase